MFEEVPRRRRGLIQLTSRPIALGPFVLGGGITIAALGGSVAVAATVITASTIGVADLVPKHSHRVVASPASSHSRRPLAPTSPGAAVQRAVGLPTVASSSMRTGSASEPPASTVVAAPVPSGTARPSPSSPSAGPSTAGASTGTASASPSYTQPAGNAVVFFNGFDDASGSLLFEYASVSRGTGPGGSDVYSVSSPQQYRAKLAAGASIISGTTICPPAGSRCTPDQLISAAPGGVYAEVAIGAGGFLQSVIERDNAPANDRAPAYSPSSTPAPAPSASQSPSDPSTPQAAAS